MKARFAREQEDREHGMRLVCWCAVLGVLVAGCTAETDQEIYELHEEARGRFTNNMPHIPAFLGGCGFFYKEKRVGDEWVDRGSDIVCFWEGYAVAVAPGASAEQAFLTDETGTWRLVYDVGLLCSETEPLRPRNCTVFGHIESNEYQVVSPEEPVGERLCQDTTGVWDLLSCGHYFCGSPPLCRAIIPGCDCGVGRNFDPELGCLEDPVCVQGPPCYLDSAGPYACPPD